MSNTVITNYTDLNGPSAKADSSVVVIVNKDGTLSVDQNLLDTLMGTDGTQSAISVVRVGHEGKPDDATDSESEDDNIPHVTLSVDSYYDEPNSIIKYDSGAEMLQSLRIETRENSLVGFQNDHCYTPLMSSSPSLPQRNEGLATFEEPVLEITHTPPPKPIPNSKKITILEQQIIPKGKKILINAPESPIILKGNDVLHKPLPVLPKTKEMKKAPKIAKVQKEDSSESSSISSSGESIQDRDSDSDYKDTRDRNVPVKVRKTKMKPRILKTRLPKQDAKPPAKLKVHKALKADVKEKAVQQPITEQKDSELDIESILPSSRIQSNVAISTTNDLNKNVVKVTPKPIKKEKKTPAHVTALLSDMTSLFSTPDVIRRVSIDNKNPTKTDKESANDKKTTPTPKTPESSDVIPKVDSGKSEIVERAKLPPAKTYGKQKDKNVTATEKPAKSFDSIPQLDEASLAQILQDPTGITPVKTQAQIPSANVISSPGLAGPLSPTLDLLGGLQPEEEGLTEDLLMHVAQLVESSENLQEVIDKQVLGKVDTSSAKTVNQSPFQQGQAANNLYMQTLSKAVNKPVVRKDPIEIVRRDGRVITLPPIEAPATRSSKRKSQIETTTTEALGAMLSAPTHVVPPSPEPPQVQPVSKQYLNKKLANKKQENLIQSTVVEKNSAESQESWNSEDDPNRLWCICKQPHNNRFMICCDSCEDWFHGKCVNITKAMGQQMEDQGIEWRCPNCIKKAKPQPKSTPIHKQSFVQKKIEQVISTMDNQTPAISPKEASLKTSCIVCKKSARASSIYCSDACILKHAQDSLGTQAVTKTEGEMGKTQDKQKSDSRVIVYERKSGRLLAGPNAPTAENLKSWLQKNPTFEVVRPGTLSTIKPNTSKKKASNEPNKIQTTLNFERIPRKAAEQNLLVKSQQPEVKEKINKLMMSPREEIKSPTTKTAATKPPILGKSPISQKVATLRTPMTKSNTLQLIDTPKASTSSAKTMSEPRKPAKSNATNRTPSLDKAPPVTPTTSRRKDSQSRRMESSDPIRDNVRKALQEQMSNRMAENTGPKFTEEEIQQFAVDTETELHDLFRDVGMKYKAKYRSLMFNIKDRKNLSLWQKICDRSITPHQLVRLSPEELASQELAEWRDQEAKHQLELIKKSELDLLAASKTYVLKTHKGEEVMENKESVSTELDPNVPVEDVVIALNDSTVGEEVTKEVLPDISTSKPESTVKKHGTRKRGKEDSNSSQSKKSKKDSERRKSRSSRRKSDSRVKESKEQHRRSTRKSDKKSPRPRSESRDKAKSDKEKSDLVESSRRRSRDKRKRSRDRSRSRSKERSQSSGRARRRSRSQSRDSAKRKRRSRSKHSSSVDEKVKHRSRSQENVYNKKNDSTDSDSLERPKSATLKEVHPEYDPHEPMITSAFSEEDLRKSREDVFEESFKTDIGGVVPEYDSSKAFSIDSDVIMPSTTTYLPKQDKTSEAESDQEPSSTVENSAATVWNGCINMVDVARFYVAAHEVSGSSVDLEEDLSTELDIVGRINPDTVWDYIGKMKKASNKDIVILRLQAANDEEKMQYIALYSYLSSRNRLGVVKVSSTTTVKDFYILPLPGNTSLPSVLLPLDGPGLGDVKTHLLLAIVIRQRKKRLAPHIPKDIVPAKVPRDSHKPLYPVPPMVQKASYTPPTSPRRRPPLPFPSYTSTALSTSVKDKIAASLAAADDDEAYSPGSSDSSGSGVAPTVLPPGLASKTLQTKMEELNRQIEEQKQQILKMTRVDSSVGEDEAYSPSRPMTPPSVVDTVPLADIALPSNLHEILATIKQRSEPTNSGDVDLRTLPLP